MQQMKKEKEKRMCAINILHDLFEIRKLVEWMLFARSLMLEKLNIHTVFVVGDGLKIKSAFCI